MELLLWMTHSSCFLCFFWSSLEDSPSRPLTSSLICKGSRLVVTSTSMQLYFCEQSCSCSCCCCCRSLSSNRPKLNYKKTNNDPRMISLKVATAATTTLMREKKLTPRTGIQMWTDTVGGNVEKQEPESWSWPKPDSMWVIPRIVRHAVITKLAQTPAGGRRQNQRQAGRK